MQEAILKTNDVKKGRYSSLIQPTMEPYKTKTIGKNNNESTCS